MMCAGELSDRERRCLEGVARGCTTKEIARDLEISHRTVDHHVAHAMQKLHVRTRTAAVVEAYFRGEISLGRPHSVQGDLLRVASGGRDAGRKSVTSMP